MEADNDPDIGYDENPKEGSKRKQDRDRRRRRRERGDRSDREESESGRSSGRKESGRRGKSGRSRSRNGRQNESDTSFSESDYEQKKVREIRPNKNKTSDRHGRMPEMSGPGGFSNTINDGNTGTAEQLMAMQANAPIDVDYLAGIDEEGSIV